MNKAIILVAVAIVAAAGISAFALMSSDSGEVTPIVQEPIAEKPAIVEEEVSIEETAVVEEPKPNLKGMSKIELEEYGRTIGIELDRRKKKADLIAELEDCLH